MNKVMGFLANHTKFQYLLFLSIVLVLGSSDLLPVPYFKYLVVISLIVCFLFFHPKLNICAITVWIPIQYWITKVLEVVPVYFVWIDEFLLVVLTFTWLSRKLLNGEGFVKSPVDMPILLFVTIGILSAAINYVNPIQASLGIRGLLQYALIYYAILNLELNESFLRKLFFISLSIAVGQFFVVVYQANIYGWHVFGRGAFDLITGTMGPHGANGLGYFTLMYIFLLLGIMLHKKGTKLLFFVLFFLLFVPLILSSTRGAYLIMVLFLMPLSIKYIIKPSRKLLYFLLPVVLLTLGIVYYINRSEHKEATKRCYFSIEQELRLEMDVQVVGRLGFYPIAYYILTDTKLGPVIGRGPGTFSSFTGTHFKAPLFYDLYGTTLKEDKSYPSQLIATTVEFGFLGIIVFFFIIYRFYKIRELVYNTTKSMFWKGIAFGFLGLLFIFILPTIIANVWEVQYIAFYVWLYSGVLYKVYTMERKGAFDEGPVS